MINKQSIILGYHRHGKSKKQLARDLGISLKTVKRYLLEHKQEMTLIGTKEDDLPLEGIVSPPRYKSVNRKKRVLTKTITDLIDGYLIQNKRKRDQGNHKQQLKKIDIHQALERAGHQIGYTTVRTYINVQLKKGKEVYIRQHYQAGQAAEFDWGEVKVNIKGVRYRIMLAVFTSCYSNHRWARLYHRQDMCSFQDAHSEYFAYTKGVQGELVYDNMRTAVRKYTLRNDEKTPTEGLLKMSCYYKFDYRFCNARRGNEKGHVERSVEYIRRKAFAVRDEFASLQAANIYLIEICEQLNAKAVGGKRRSIQSAFEEELEHMKTAPPAFDAAELACRRVDKYSCIKVDNNWYSVPEGCVGFVLNVKIYPDRLLIYNLDNEPVAKHWRSRGHYEYLLQIAHYLQTLNRKPGALKGSLSLRQADETLRQIFFQHFKKTPRHFVELLLHLREKQYSISQLQEAVKQCLELCPHQDPCVDKIKILLQPRTENTPLPNQLEGAFAKQIKQQCTAQLQAIQNLISSSI